MEFIYIKKGVNWRKAIIQPSSRETFSKCKTGHCCAKIPSQKPEKPAWSKYPADAQYCEERTALLPFSAGGTNQRKRAHVESALVSLAKPLGLIVLTFLIRFSVNTILIYRFLYSMLHSP